VPDRVLGQIGQVVNPDLRADAASIGLDRRHRYAETLRDVLGRQPLGQELEPLALAARKLSRDARGKLLLGPFGRTKPSTTALAIPGLT
jgi:hypothetical protein